MEIVIGIIAIGILWIVLTGKKRRASKLKAEIYQLVRSGRGNVILDNIFFEAALKFALESGAELEHGKSVLYTDSIHFNMNIDGTNYLIYFAKQPNGSTFLGVTDMDEGQKLFQERLKQSRSN